MQKRILQTGFTLIETLVALSILSIAIMGTMAAAQNGISSSIFSKNQVIAFYLAADGVEQIRYLRDTNVINGRHWLSGISSGPSDPCYFGKSCYVDTITNAVTQCSGSPSTCPGLRLSGVSGFYGYNPSWSRTTFRRSITLTQINANEVAVTVSVMWSKGVINRQFTVRENILNWQ